MIGLTTTQELPLENSPADLGIGGALIAVDAELGAAGGGRRTLAGRVARTPYRFYWEQNCETKTEYEFNLL